MKLSDDQVQYLFRFTEKHRVEWYDLQAELVDHLASRMEEEMDADPQLTFEACLEKVYKQFGIFGFSRIVQEKTGQLYRQSRRIWWRSLVEFFTWPKLLLLFLLFYAFWQFGAWFDYRFLVFGLLVADVSASFVLIRLMSKAGKGKRKLLLLQSVTGYKGSLLFIYQIVLVFGNDYFGRLEFCLLATLGVLVKLAAFQVFFKVRKKALELYPEA